MRGQTIACISMAALIESARQGCWEPRTVKKLREHASEGFDHSQAAPMHAAPETSWANGDSATSILAAIPLYPQRQRDEPSARSHDFSGASMKGTAAGLPRCVPAPLRRPRRLLAAKLSGCDDRLLPRPQRSLSHAS